MSMNSKTRIASVESATVVNNDLQLDKQVSFAEQIANSNEQQQSFVSKILATQNQKEMQI